jgi:NTP pyrophosphatase (non-canonical NTP hydrolase)
MLSDSSSSVLTTPLVDVSALSLALADFARARDWDQYHSPKNLVMALTGEIGELSEIFQWLTEAASRTVATDPETASAVREEIADIVLYLVRLSDVLGIDLNQAVSDKLKKNAINYPIDKARGSSRKYNQL